MTGPGGLVYGRYSTSGHREWLMRIGPAGGAPILFVPPLLEEMNRTRAFLATIMRLLGRRGFACWLPDLPGTGESERPLKGIGWGQWQQAVADAAANASNGRKLLIASFRGGALLDKVAEMPVWRFAPADGSSLARDLVRASMLKPDALEQVRIELAGYRLSDTLFAAMGAARIVPAEPLRTVRLASDRAEADLKVDGPALWRRSEPGNSPELAALLADDLTEWWQRCAAS